MKKRYIAGMMAGVAVIAIFTICFTQGKKENIKDEKELITIGFSQVGAESDWRTANSISIKETFTPERGYDLIFEDARQDQSNQIMAIRSFIQQDVDYIIFSPVVEDGWDTVLEEAKRARIPVIVIDRMVNVKDDSLYTAWVGSDFYMQGEKACAALKAYVDAQEMEKVNIVHIQGTLGATAQIARTQALTEAASRYGWNIVAQESGDYTEAGAYEIMNRVLNEYDDIDFVYCENDNETFGALEAIKKKYSNGGGIKLISFDATEKGLRYTMNGNIMINMECNPMQGPEAEKIIKQLQDGKTPQKQALVPEQIFVDGNVITDVCVDGKTYDVQPVTEELIEMRDY